MHTFEHSTMVWRIWFAIEFYKITVGYKWFLCSSSSKGIPQCGHELLRLLLFLFLISSRKPAVIIPAGSAKMATPASKIMLVKIFPAAVIGIKSPYPTVVSVTTLHQIVEGILLNLSG